MASGTQRVEARKASGVTVAGLADSVPLESPPVSPSAGSPLPPDFPMRLTSVITTALVAVALQTAAAAPLGAQLLDAKVVSLDAARKMLAAADAEARKNGWTVSIAIVDAAGTLIAFQRMDNAALTTADVSIGKARTAARMRRPTKALDSLITTGRIQYLAFDGIMPLEGGLPITFQGKVIGGMAASGATSAQDAQIAAAGIAALVP